MDNVIFVTTTLIIIGWVCLEIFKTYCILVEATPFMPHSNVTTKTIDFDGDSKISAEANEEKKYLYMRHMNPDLEVKPIEAINHNSRTQRIGAEEQLRLRDDCKIEKFYTKDVVPKNDRNLKINSASILMYPLHTRMWRLGVTNYAEMYKKYPQYITEQEYNELELYRLEQGDFTSEKTVDRGLNSSLDEVTDDFLNHSLEERMERLNVDTYTQMCKDYPEYVTYDEFQSLLDNGLIYSVDNIIEFKGIYFDNYRSDEAEWRRYDRFRELYSEHYERNNSGNKLIDEFPHDYYEEQISDLEDMEYYGSDMSGEELSDEFDGVLDEYASALEKYDDRNNN